ncbi:MAG: hypothetical protein LGB07_01045 [Sulfurovum sp.]|nr:hypothetical protein [Sulfurovum sp.]MCB4744234.1 hypothetical protein [Sulfurovum sp.]MCB4746929.1 hypothetical protein [Sulfurovum sp.]MCB4749058.1 hypothetical protein [Sulfurovum sp.]MCB4750862.1 hypothetical protein [Sulfurovum sp.]
MYCIINQDRQIIAIDSQLLSNIGISNTDTFYKKVDLQEIIFNLGEEEVAISTGSTTKYYSATISCLVGKTGDIYLVNIHEEKSGADISISEEKTEEAIDLDLDIVELFENEESTSEEAVSTASEEDKETIALDPDIAELFENEESTSEETVSTASEEDKDLFELILPDDTEPEITETQSSLQDHNEPIYIDIKHISEKIGISADDYNLFLKEYIDTALGLRQILQGQNEKERKEALHTLIHLSNVLHLPFAEDTLKQISNASSTEQRNTVIESFFKILDTVHSKKEDLSSEGERAPIDLSDIKPVHFDFHIKESAEKLALPVDLVEEFINDFTVQAREETEKILASYNDNNLETIQKIGHLLKGTSSNLYIEPLADTLHKIELNQDIDRVPELVKNYWAYFLSLENQVKSVSE